MPITLNLHFDSLNTAPALVGLQHLLQALVMLKTVLDKDENVVDRIYCTGLPVQNVGHHPLKTLWRRCDPKGRWQKQ